MIADKKDNHNFIGLSINKIKQVFNSDNEKNYLNG